jgi:hypothetical protein
MIAGMLRCGVGKAWALPREEAGPVYRNFEVRCIYC